MQLTRVDIQNYRSIKNATITFDQNLRVIVGLNESGKSNIISALGLLDPSAKPVVDDVREPLASEQPGSASWVRFVFAPSTTIREQILADLQKRLAVGEERSAIVVDGTDRKSLADVVAELDVVYIVNVANGSRSVTTWTIAGRKLAFKMYAPTKKIAAPAIVLDGTPRPISSFEMIDEAMIDDPAKYVEVSEREFQSLLATATKAVGEPHIPKCVTWTFHPDHILPGKVELATFKTNPDHCSPLKRLFLVAGVNDIPKAISQAEARRNGVKNLLNRVGDLATKHIREVWREAKDIEIALSQNGAHIECVIQDKENAFDLLRRSDGFKRFVTLMIMITSQVRSGLIQNNLLLMDEPDLGLHPSGVRCLAKELMSVARSNKVVVATHSIFMIDPERIDRHIIVTRKGEITTVEDVGVSNVMDEEVIYNAMGYSVFEQLPQRVIIFEGWKDKKLFKMALSRVPSQHQIIKEVLGGCGSCHASGAKDIARVGALMELARRTIVILSDADEPSREKRRDYRGDGTWYTYGDLLPECEGFTCEDYLEAGYIQRIATECLKAVDGIVPHDLVLTDGPPVLNQIRAWMRQSSVSNDRIKPLIETIKLRAFEMLERKYIRPQYYEVLHLLAQKMSTLVVDENEGG